MNTNDFEMEIKIVGEVLPSVRNKLKLLACLEGIPLQDFVGKILTEYANTKSIKVE